MTATKPSSAEPRESTKPSSAQPRESTTEAGLLRRSAASVVATVKDPELPVLTLADLGVIRAVTEHADGVMVSITPTYSGCPAMQSIRDDIVTALHAAGYPRVVVRTVLAPAWTSDWISAAGRTKLANTGIAPPGRAPQRSAGPVPLVLNARGPAVACPRCGHLDSEVIASFSATACRDLRRCPQCREPFEHVKEI